jgi:hypothetical protein
MPAYGSLPPISGYTDTGGFSKPPGVESTWSLASPVVNADQVSQQPAWALLGDAPSFWPDERYRPGSPEDGPLEMSSVDSLPLEPVPSGHGYHPPEPMGLDGFEPARPADAWRPAESAAGDDPRPDQDSWASPAEPAGDLLGTTDSLHAVLTLDDAVTRERQARSDRLGRHRSS